MKNARTYLRENALTVALLLVCGVLAIVLLRRGGGQSAAVAVDPAVAVAVGGESSPQSSAKPENVLARVIPELDLGDQPKLAEAFDAVARSAHCPIHVNWKVLDADGFGPGEPASLRGVHRNITVAQAIEHILPYGIGLAAIDGNVYISNELEFSYHKQMLVYNVRDIIDAAARTAAANSAPDAVRRQDAVNQLTWIITNYISSDTWRDNGGNIGSITEINGLLVITQTPENHQQISEFLRQFRQTSRSDISSRTRALAAGTDPQTAMPADGALATLSKKLPPLPLQRPRTFQEALRLIQEAVRSQILVDWNSLSTAGIERDRPIDIPWPFGPITVQEALNVILSSLADDVRPPRRADATVTRQGNMIIVTTSAGLKQYTQIVDYNLRDLIQAMIDNSAADATREAAITHGEAADQISRAITDMIDPDSWRDNGGSIGTIKEIMGILVVQQTPENQDAVRKMLDDLRKANAIGAKPN